jgi:ABC-type lipoprotein export system ATPase subunit
MNDTDQISNDLQPMVRAENLIKIYKTSELEVLALQGLDLTIEKGELMAIIGNSGSGKSTFMNMLGGLDEPSAGSLWVDGKNLFALSHQERVLYKRNTVGFVWQNSGRNMLPYLSAYENIITPMQFSSEKLKKERAMELLDLVGMSHRKGSRMNQLSGGEQQRIAIAIALANKPKLLLADEPTGSVDKKTADYILDVFRKLNKEYNQTTIIVTHDVELTKKVQRVVAIRDGKISSERILKEHYAMNLGSSTINWMEEDTQEEYAIIDKVGRVQIPRRLIDMLHIEGNRVKLIHEDNEIKMRKP